mmetsp:Transcript_49902/g.116487  ORF Transcript_49902/g.116487 Transcript_49902/m.116487 type:complete len:318 (+) Transcript_49902:1352-2305(+)
MHAQRSQCQVFVDLARRRRQLFLRGDLEIFLGLTVLDFDGELLLLQRSPFQLSVLWVELEPRGQTLPICLRGSGIRACKWQPVLHWLPDLLQHRREVFNFPLCTRGVCRGSTSDVHGGARSGGDSRGAGAHRRRGQRGGEGSHCGNWGYLSSFFWRIDRDHHQGVGARVASWPEPENSRLHRCGRANQLPLDAVKAQPVRPSASRVGFHRVIAGIISKPKQIFWKLVVQESTLVGIHYKHDWLGVRGGGGGEHLDPVDLRDSLFMDVLGLHCQVHLRRGGIWRRAAGNLHLYRVEGDPRRKGITFARRGSVGPPWVG